jgi:hypothetical protein
VFKMPEKPVATRGSLSGVLVVEDYLLLRVNPTQLKKPTDQPLKSMKRSVSCVMQAHAVEIPVDRSMQMSLGIFLTGAGIDNYQLWMPDLSQELLRLGQQLRTLKALLYHGNLLCWNYGNLICP